MAESQTSKSLSLKGQTEYEKNIQLSEKLEYLLTTGNLVAYAGAEGKIYFFYKNEKMQIYKLRKDCRLLDFVNDLIEEKGLYPLVQKFHANKK